MTFRSAWILLLFLVVLRPAPGARGEEPAAAPGDKEPVLRLEAEGPTSFVTALAFSADGRTLYAGGWDKVVRVWTLNDKGQFVPDRLSAYRVPVGPGLDGAINAIALSDDGVWLAAAGRAVYRQAAGFRQAGFIVPVAGGMTEAMRRDMGTIYVFNTKDQTVRLLTGHRGVVDGLAFAPVSVPGQPPRLLSTAQENLPETDKFRWSARIWDVARGESGAAAPDLPLVPAAPPRPGLALWQRGERKGIRAALAFPDGKFRVWDGGADRQSLKEIQDLRHTVALARLPGSDQVLVAGYGKGEAQLTLWQMSEDEPRSLTPKPAFAGDSFPRALGLLASKANERPDRAAVLLRVPRAGSDEEDVKLHVVDVDQYKLGEVKVRVDLWRGKPREPVLATAPGGRHLAVAGQKDHRIRIYALDKLLGGAEAAPQELRSVGVTYQHVSFVRQGKELGLLLNRSPRSLPGEAVPAPGGIKGDQVFAFGERAWASDPGKWTFDAPDAGTWQAEYVTKGGRAIRVLQGDRELQRLSLGAREELSTFALLPPRGPRQAALLALATHDAGQPRLVLYQVSNAKAPQPLRQYTGHVDRLHALAFSADGRLLVSSAEDQTVCVWSLADLDEVLGRAGQLDGVAVRSRGENVVVDQVDKASPAVDRLRPGETIVGLMDKGKLFPLGSPHAFYQAFFLSKPGDQITLRVSGPGEPRDVTLPVGQGVDERKPLLSLFATAGEKDEEREWIGWNPLGPYDASSPKAERYLGWHFNTGDPKRPTRFARAEDHRKEYYQQGILNKLVQEGALRKVELPPPAPPLILLSLREGDEYRGAKGQEVVRRPGVTLNVDIRDRSLEDLSSLSWRLDDGAEQPLPLDRPDAEALAIPLKLSRGDHQVLITAQPREAAEQPVRERLLLRYEPPPPRITYKGARQLSGKQATFDLQADILPGADGEKVRVTLRQRNDGKDILDDTRTYTIHPDRPLRIDRRLALDVGDNVIEVSAVNEGAPAERVQKGEETARLSLEVFRIKEAARPLISFLGVTSPGEAGGKEERRTIEHPLDPLVVHAPRVRLDGTIRAEENLRRAARYAGQSPRGVPLDRFEANKHAEFAFSEELRLTPGRQTFRFQAQTETSELAERVLTVDYRPLLPVAQLTEPRDGAVVYADRDLKDTAVVQVRGRLSRPADQHPYRATVVVNDRESTAAAILDANAGTLTIPATLSPGDNRIRLKLSNAWSMESSTEDILVRYRRPPYVLDVKQAEAKGKPALNLEARVRSPLPLKDVVVEVNGRSSTPERIQIDKVGADLHTIRLTGVTLEAGRKESEIRVHVSNDEARCRQPGVLNVETASVLPPPEVQFLTPLQDHTVDKPRVTVRFQVHSVSPLTLVRVVRKGHPPTPIDLAKVERDGAGRERLTAETVVDLADGLNSLWVEADNASGRQAGPVRLVTYCRPPLSVEIDRLVTKKVGGKEVRVQHLPGGKIAFPEVDSGHVRLHGRIVWPDAKADPRRKNLRIRIYVNGFQQLQAYPGSSAGDSFQTPFEADLLLNREKDNQVRLTVLGQDAGSPRSEFEVDCRQPIKGQRLHLLILGPQATDADALKQEVLKVLQSQIDPRVLKTPAFDQVRVVVGSKVWGGYVYPQLVAIKESISDVARTQQTPMNDVLLIYYQGGEEVRKDGNFFQTHSVSGRPGMKQFGMPCDELVKYLADIPGAQVLLLDVKRDWLRDPGPPRDKIVHWGDDYPQVRGNVVVMRYAWEEEKAAVRGTRLLTIMEKTLPRAARLGDVVELIREGIEAAPRPGLLVFTYHLPDDLKTLIIGRKP
jgi:WD40 repeat protein